jgi:hypothetical protein
MMIRCLYFTFEILTHNTMFGLEEKVEGKKVKGKKIKGKKDGRK